MIRIFSILILLLLLPETTHAARQTILSGAGVLWQTEAAKINSNDSELYSRLSDAAYSRETWNGSSLLPTQNAISDLIELLALKTAVLQLTNTTSFTPTADYHPATKKYVDDAGVGDGISHATSDGNYYASRNGSWTSLAGVYLTPSGSAAALTNFPTLNQNTTGGAAYLTTARLIGGVSFNGTLNINLPGVNIAGTQNTTGTATGLAAAYIDWSATSGGTSIKNKPTLFDPASPGAIGGTTPAAGTFTALSASSYSTTAADGSRRSILPNNTSISPVGDGSEEIYNEGGIIKVVIGNTEYSNGYVVASGTSTLGAAAISAGQCATVVSSAATGVVTTDTIVYVPNTRLSQVTGYTTAGRLTIDAYPTAGYVNFDVCNYTASSVDPDAVTLNWKVQR